MAKELQALATTASTVYAQIFRDSDGLIWNTAGTPAFQAYDTANIADYDIAMTEAGTASGYFTGDLPALAAGTYTYVSRVRAGGAPAESDSVVTIGRIHWDGSAVVDLATLTARLTATRGGYLDNLSGGAVATQASVNTIDDFLDTEVAAILAAVDTEVGAIKTVTDAIGATGSGLSAIPWNASWDAEIQSECTDALNAYDPPTNAEMEARTIAAASYATAANLATVAGYLDTEIAAILEDTGTTIPAQISALNNLSQAQAQTAAEAALVTHRLDELLNADSDIDGAAPPTVGSVFHELMSKTTGSFTFDQTTDSCEAVRDRGDAAWTTGGSSTLTAADVWSYATRILTAGTNIALAKGTGVTGFTDIDAAGVRTAVGLASASLDTQIDALPTNAELATALDSADDAMLAQIALVKAQTDLLPASPAAVGSAMTLTSGERDSIAAAILDLAAGVETNLTPRQLLRLLAAVIAGKSSGGGGTYRDYNDTKNRIVATLDGSSNRTAVTRDVS